MNATPPDASDNGQAWTRTRADGPWRIAEGCIVCMRAAPGEPDASGRLAAIETELRRIGFPVSDVVLIAPEARSRLDPKEIEHDVVRKPVPTFRHHALADVLDAAAVHKTDLLVMDPGVAIAPEAVVELRRVASTDPMIAAVSPCPDDLGSTEATAGARRRILPAVSYVPLADSRCLYLKGSVLAQFRRDAAGDGLDWDTYALHLSRVGFRMALANHAPFRPGAAPDQGLDLAARALRLEPAFPGTRGAVASFLSGSPRSAERLLGGLLSDASGRRVVAFDLTHVGAKRSGTAEAALALIRRAVTAWDNDWSVAVVAPAAVHAFHFGSNPNAPRRIDPEDPMVCAAFIRFGQPFGWKEVDAAVRRAPALVFLMLDTIGLDCIRLAPDDLDALWRFTLAEADGLLFNSAFTQRQFQRRFGVRPGQPRRASLHSLDITEYAKGRVAGTASETILIIGNAFAHKCVEETARLLAKAGLGRPIVALGLAPGAVEGVIGHLSGSLDDDTLGSLYEQAALVVYPSLYEGFGLPLLEALAHRKPVLARALEPFAEIAAGLPEGANLHVFETKEDLVALCRAAPEWIDTRDPRKPRGWDDALGDLRHVLEEAVSAVDYERVVRRIDFMRGRLAWIRHKPLTDDEASGEDLDRLAALAGRMARRAVHGLAGLPGGRAMIRWTAGLGRRDRGP